MLRTLGEPLGVAPSPPSGPELESALGPLRWLLAACREGVVLTQAGYLPPVLVREAVARFGWWDPVIGNARSEIDVYEVTVLRQVAVRLRLVTKRRGRLKTSALGVAYEDDPVGLWRALAGKVGCADDYSTMLTQLIIHRLLRGAVDGDELTSEIVPIITAQGWREGRAELDPRQIGYSIHEPLREWRLFGLLDEKMPRWAEGLRTQRWTISLTPIGRTTALFQLHSRA